ncbi:M15 family metallopeptidase [Candidatus Protochlamydia phocaeensis]|uniref:M15 family metallopeptidase n=1 Tax=Candidatus Protochlamydia phocaeensis TaxID=1414722 RepID=UPI0008385D7F|nr:M15 family metallopeptidase [Candidatus Protochlamydia phocaeensis]
MNLFSAVSHSAASDTVGLSKQFPCHVVSLSDIRYVQKYFCNLEEKICGELELRLFEDITDKEYQDLFYSDKRAFIHEEAAEGLLRASKSLREQGARLVVYATYRSKRIENWIDEKLKDCLIHPYQRNVLYSCGRAVTVSLMKDTGDPIDMHEGEFDLLQMIQQQCQRAESPSADILKNREELKKAMEEVGFEQSPYFWWEFSFKKQSDCLEQRDFPSLDFYMVEIEEILQTKKKLKACS